MKKSLVCFFMLLIKGSVVAQSTLITAEDFDVPNNQILLNDTGIGGNFGPNKWIVNNVYQGNGIYPNTISQDSTYGGLISNPNGNYLHIHDSAMLANSGVSNANYFPLASSDRFSVLGDFCTLGFTDVRFAFYYLCVGDSNNAFGEVYYSADFGPWLPASSIQYRSTPKWKYEELINPAFNNLGSLRVGVRWINNSSGTFPGTTSFSIDHIRLVGDFDENLVGFGIDSIVPVPICQGASALAYYHLDAPLCGLGFYDFELSSITGTFNNPTSLGIYQLNNLNTNGILFLTIPPTVQPSACYKIRIIRMDVVPNVVGDTTDCIPVIQCPNIITTLPPVVLSNPADTICVGSVIDVPFYSTGVYANNTYIAQLSDSNGVFPPNPNVLGSSNDNTTYDPAQGSLPGNVSGLIQPGFHPIPPGCNYYIRVVSTNAPAIGSVYGPFCIRNCDIETNDRLDIQACITDTTGFDTLLTISINNFDSVAVYDTSNVFQIQLLNSMTFAIISTGVVGSVQATSDTTVQLSIPTLPLLGTIGLTPGMYYMRIVASSSSTMWNNLGTLVRLTIGAPNPSPLSVLAYDPTNFTGYLNITDSTICIGQAVYFFLSPWNPVSDYVWTLNNNNNWANTAFQGILFNGAGVWNVSVIETNFGCVGPGSDTAVITSIGPPNAFISGPSQVCQNDTVSFSVQLQAQTFYDWFSPNGTVLDTLNNVVDIVFDSAGVGTVNVDALNECGTASAFRNITVRPLPDIDAQPDTSVCPGEEVRISTPSGNNYTYSWRDSSGVVSTDSSFIVSPDEDEVYFLTVTAFPFLNGGCKSRDTLTINVKDPGPSATLDTVICPGLPLTIASSFPGDSYEWSSGENDPAISVSLPGQYIVQSFNQVRCAARDTFNVNASDCESLVDTIFVPNVFTPNSDGRNDGFRLINKNVEELSIVIYNRWGQKVAEWTDPSYSWDGVHYKNGSICSAGVYYYVLRYKFIGKTAVDGSGFITLRR